MANGNFASPQTCAPGPTLRRGGRGACGGGVSAIPSLRRRGLFTPEPLALHLRNFLRQQSGLGVSAASASSVHVQVSSIRLVPLACAAVVACRLQCIVCSARWVVCGLEMFRHVCDSRVWSGKQVDVYTILLAGAGQSQTCERCWGLGPQTCRTVSDLGAWGRAHVEHSSILVSVL